MFRFAMILIMVIGLAVIGCGEQPQTDGDAQAGDVSDDNGDVQDSGDTGDVTVLSSGDFDFQCPDLEVGQWISYGVVDETGEVVFSVVAEEEFDGDDCLWIQIEAEDFVGQILIDPAGIKTAMSGYEVQFDEFIVDPAEYIREQMEAGSGDMAQMFMNEEYLENSMDFLRALKMVKFDNEGMIMALDLTGVPALLEPYMSDPEMLTQGFDMSADQTEMDEFLNELDNIEFGIDEIDFDVAGNTVDSWEFSLVHPDGEAVAVISSELPIIPVAYISVSDFGDGDGGAIEVIGYGFDGAENKLGEPAQVLDAAMFMEGMLAQAGAMNAQIEQ